MEISFGEKKEDERKRETSIRVWAGSYMRCEGFTEWKNQFEMKRFGVCVSRGLIVDAKPSESNTYENYVVVWAENESEAKDIVGKIIGRDVSENSVECLITPQP